MVFQEVRPLMVIYLWGVVVFTLASPSMGQVSELFNFRPPGSDYDVETVCEKHSGEACQLVEMKMKNLHELLTKKIKEFTVPSTIGNGELVFRLKVARDTPVADYYFASFQSQEGSEAVFTVNRNSLAIHGVFHIINNGTTDIYTIINCGKNCQTFEKYSKESERRELEQDGVDVHVRNPHKGRDYYSNDEMVELNKGYTPEWNETVAQISITFYLTPEFLDKYTDPLGVISLLLSQTNRGYEANNIPIVLSLHCIRKAPFSEKESRWADGESWQNGEGDKSALFTFANLDTPDNKWNNLRVSADMAYLLLGGENSKISGETVLLPYGEYDGASIGYVYATSAAASFTLDHEIGHIYGCWHDSTKKSKNKYVDYAHGFNIPSEDREGFRTIMAYATEGHEQRLQYYSSTVIKGVAPSGETIRLGDEGHDNRKLILARRFQVAGIGDETMECTDNLFPSLRSRGGGNRGDQTLSDYRGLKMLQPQGRAGPEGRNRGPSGYWKRKQSDYMDLMHSGGVEELDVKPRSDPTVHLKGTRDTAPAIQTQDFVRMPKHDLFKSSLNGIPAKEDPELERYRWPAVGSSGELKPPPRSTLSSRRYRAATSPRHAQPISHLAPPSFVKRSEMFNNLFTLTNRKELKEKFDHMR